ncbi:MAG: DNA alkylation repair protein [Planctomycetota bacterium]
MPTTDHPIERFDAPRAITAGQPLADLFDRRLARLIGESFHAVDAGFDAARFARRASRDLDGLSMSERNARFADALAEQLPDDFAAASRLLVAALGPERPLDDDRGLRCFFYMPHATFVATRGADPVTGDFDAGMAANLEITKRFTAEFSVRPFLERHQRRALALLKKWTRDSDAHVRRLCSEGTRPRLPWASRLSALQADPELAAPLLHALRDDPELYVRRSVANHLGDVCKDHPEWVYALCRAWLEEVDGGDAERAKNRRWMVRHAVRHPAKKGTAAALELRRLAK